MRDHGQDPRSRQLEDPLSGSPPDGGLRRWSSRRDPSTRMRDGGPRPTTVPKPHAPQWCFNGQILPEPQHLGGHMRNGLRIQCQVSHRNVFSCAGEPSKEVQKQGWTGFFGPANGISPIPAAEKAFIYLVAVGGLCSPGTWPQFVKLFPQPLDTEILPGGIGNVLPWAKAQNVPAHVSGGVSSHYRWTCVAKAQGQREIKESAGLVSRTLYTTTFLVEEHGGHVKI